MAFTMASRRLITVVATVSAICGFAETTVMVYGCQSAQSSLRIVIVEGDGAVNVIARNQVRSRQIVVRVDDDAGKPVSGATVSFRMPASNEAGGKIGGQSAVSVLTDIAGLAKITFQPNGLAGTFDIGINVSSQGRSASTFVSQTNLQSAANVTGHDKLWRFLGFGAAALAVAVLLANPSRSTPGIPPARRPPG